MTTAAVTGVDALEATFARYLPQIVLAAVVPIAVLAIVVSIDPLAAGVMVLTLPLVPVFMWLVGQRTARRARERWQALALLSNHFLDVVRGLPTLRAFNRGAVQAERIASVSDEYRRTTMGTLRLAFLSGAILELAATLGIALVAVVVGVRLAEGDIGFEAALTVLVLTPELYLPIRNLAAQWHASADGAAVAERLLDLSEAPAVAVESVAASDAALAPIAFERVSFGTRHASSTCSATSSSSSSRARLSRSSGRAAPGSPRCCLFSCASPSRRPGGFSSAATTSPSIDPRAWRRLTAYVPQQPTLFRGTVADNIRLGAPAAADEEVRAAARSRRAPHDFVYALPDGYETVVGDGGRPSRRGRRRVALARAFLRDAPLVLLDEPTADLDPESASIVADAVDVLARGQDARARCAPSRARRACRPDRPHRRRGGGGAHERRSVACSGLPSMPRGRMALALVLGALAVGFGVALMTAAGYLISRAAEQPPILALTTTIVVVRFLALARPLARYLERLASHDLALRALGRIRSTCLRAHRAARAGASSTRTVAATS